MAKAKSGTAATTTTSRVRVRMYRVGFGDFFLVTVPSAAGPKHILIDCGVHSKDTGSIAAAVDDLATETNKELALIIVTHRHADHVTGFSKCKAVFSQFKVSRIWMSWYENPNDSKALALQQNITAITNGLQQSLAARPDDDESVQMIKNITEALPATGTQNPGAFEVLRSFPGNPPIDYYKAGDKPTLPPELVAAGLSAQILGPPDDPTAIKKTTNKSEEYVAAMVGSYGAARRPFATPFNVAPKDYKNAVFERIPKRYIEHNMTKVQPDMLAASANMANNLINNQSLVTLFTFKGKTMLFAGDAQWGNWANFMYGSITGSTMTAECKGILGKLQLYKVGHHGSTNATPKDALDVLPDSCVAMCSTAVDAYKNVPRGPLIAAINKQTENKLARSDQVAVAKAPVEKTADKLPAGIFTAVTNGDCGYIDYEV